VLYGGDHQIEKIASERLDPSVDAAKIRAIFVHPKFSRMGLGSLILEAAERAAVERGFSRFEMGSTLTGVTLYATEEVTGTSDCSKAGHLTAYDISNTFGGAGFRSTPAHKFRMRLLSTWTTERAVGSSACDSAHYFTDNGKGLPTPRENGRGLHNIEERATTMGGDLSVAGLETGGTIVEWRVPVTA